MSIDIVNHTTIASASCDKKICLWDINSGQCLKTFQGHTNSVWSISVSSDGKTLASGSLD